MCHFYYKKVSNVAIQETAKACQVDLFEKLNLSAIHVNRKTLVKDDIKLVCKFCRLERASY